MKTNFLLIAMIVLGTTFSQAQGYNLLTDHESSVFSFGYGTVGGDFIKSPKTAPRETSIIYASNEGWKGTYVNPSNGKSINYSGGLTLKPGMVMMHPGNGADHLSKVRFTAPADGSYTMNVKWTAIDEQAKKTWTWVYTNAATAKGKTYPFTPKGFKELFTKGIQGHGQSTAFTKTITMKKGEIISFEMGNGGDRYYDDALSIELNIKQTSSAAAPLTSADFNGIWGDNMPIKVTGRKVVVDMSAHGRPNATGTLIDETTIRVTFPDDKTYTGKLVAKNKIQWGPNNFWTKSR